VPQARRPDRDAPAPARLIAPFDNLVLGHADRTRVISDETRKRLFTVNGVFPGFLLVDGFVAGTWRLEGTTLRLEADRGVRAGERDGLIEEGWRLLSFATAEGTKCDVEFGWRP
jgi:hypothetical protein